MKINYAIPGDTPQVGIGYKYNAQKVLSFISIYDVGITNSGITYLSKHSDPFDNVAIHPVDSPIFMPKLFLPVKKVDSYNKYR